MSTDALFPTGYTLQRLVLFFNHIISTVYFPSIIDGAPPDSEPRYHLQHMASYPTAACGNPQYEVFMSLAKRNEQSEKGNIASRILGIAKSSFQKCFPSPWLFS